MAQLQLNISSGSSGGFATKGRITVEYTTGPGYLKVTRLRLWRDDTYGTIYGLRATIALTVGSAGTQNIVCEKSNKTGGTSSSYGYDFANKNTTPAWYTCDVTYYCVGAQSMSAYCTCSDTGSKAHRTTFTSVASSDVVPPAFVANSIQAQSVSITPTIVYLRANTYSNATYNGYETLSRQCEINPASGGDDTWVSGYGTSNTSGEAWGSLTVTGNQINDKGLLGTALRANNEIYYINGSSAEYYSNDYTPPSNLMSNPVMASGSPTVTKVTSSSIQISCPGVSNWIRNESAAFYCHALTECNSSGTSTSINYCKYATGSHQSLGTLTLNIGSSQSGGTKVTDPTTETVNAGSGYAYTFSRGSTYYYKSEGITKFLGVRRNAYSALSSIYIPYLPTLTKTSFNYIWRNSTGRVDYSLRSVTLTLSNPNNEYIGNKYMSIDSTKCLAGALNGNVLEFGDESTNYWRFNKAYNNQAISGTANVWIYYATNKYTESVIEPLHINDNWSQPAGLIKCNLGTLSIDQFGKFKAGNCGFNMPTNNTTQLPIGTMTATLQMSKSSDFSTITHQQTKTVTQYGTTNNMFDDIEMLGSDLGTNYVRIKWNLKSSSNYYDTDDVYSPVKTIESTGIIPKIDSFTGYVDLASGKIKCKVKETTGAPTSKLYLEVSRSSGGGVYQTFEVTNDTEYTLPYTEPGTIWYIRAKAVNIIGTVYAVDSSNTIIEKTYQIPYTTTSDYETKANPTISAGKILYNKNCTFNFTWTNIVTNVDHVQYNIRVVSNNTPITPTDHNNKISGYNYTFGNRKDGENVQYVLEVVLYNSFNEVIVTYMIDSNIITLDALDLGKQGFTFHTNTTYHSINYVLDTFDKNSTAEGNDNKLIQMSVELKDKTTGARIDYYFIGDENPTASSLDLTPIQNYLFDNLLANHTYILVIDTLCSNPLDFSKQHRVTEQVEVSTNDLTIYPVNNLKVNVTNKIDNKPTANSNVELKWDTPNKGDSDVVDYVISYRKNSNPETLVYVQEKEYTLASEIIPLNNDDEVYIKVGARYLDWFGNYQIKWVTVPVITAASTNYMYYDCNYPNVERVKRRIYKMPSSQSSETLVRNIHINN